AWGPRQADVRSEHALANLADLITQEGCDIISLQHEFGIWGGREGENIYAFLNHASRPLLSILHTTFAPGVRSRLQSDICKRLIEQSTTVIVLTEESRRTVESLCGGHIDHMVVVPHGIPSFPYVEPAQLRVDGHNSKTTPSRFVTLGYYREDKGF